MDAVTALECHEDAALTMPGGTSGSRSNDVGTAQRDMPARNEGSPTFGELDHLSVRRLAGGGVG
jgi:hypothetical protein